MRYATLVVVAALLLWSSIVPLAGGQLPDGTLPDGTQLLNNCVTDLTFVTPPARAHLTKEYFQAALCLGFIQGVLETSKTYNWGLHDPRAFCLPPAGIPTKQAIRIVVHYLQAHLDTRQENGAALAIRALQAAFPCASAAH